MVNTESMTAERKKKLSRQTREREWEKKKRTVDEQTNQCAKYKEDKKKREENENTCNNKSKTIPTRHEQRKRSINLWINSFFFPLQ